MSRTCSNWYLHKSCSLLENPDGGRPPISSGPEAQTKLEFSAGQQNFICTSPPLNGSKEIKGGIWNCLVKAPRIPTHTLDLKQTFKRLMFDNLSHLKTLCQQVTDFLSQTKYFTKTLNLASQLAWNKNWWNKQYTVNILPISKSCIQGCIQGNVCLIKVKLQGPPCNLHQTES